MGVRRPEDDEVIRRTGRRKNTKRWCKGKVGVEHVIETVINHTLANSGPCRWHPVWFRRNRFDERATTEQLRYSCRHSKRCVNCGRYIELWLQWEDCPDRTPRPE